MPLERCYRERTEAAFHRRFSADLLFRNGVGGTVQHLEEDRTLEPT